jgi:hypothetical protein
VSIFKNLTAFLLTDFFTFGFLVVVMLKSCWLVGEYRRFDVNKH